MRFFVIFCCLVMLMGVVFAQNRNVTFDAQLNQYPGNIPWSYNDIWGWTDNDGTDYAILGAAVGTSIVNVSDPTNIFEVTLVPGAGSGNGVGWRDMKTYQHYLYIATEASTTIQIVDLAPLPDSVSLVGGYSQLTSAPHNIYIDTTRALLYVVEDFNFNTPVRILSLADPIHPMEVGNLGNGVGTDAHDVFARGNRLYVAEGVNGTLGIFDVTNPASPVLLQRIAIPSPGYVHNVWVTDDEHYLFSTEETVGKTIKVWDIHDLNNVVLVDEYIGENHFAHNVLIRGDFAYISHYGSGFKVLDISDPANVVEVGSYNQFPDNAQPDVWGVYPYTGNGTVFISDINEGLFVLTFDGTRAYRVAGTLRDSQTNLPVADGFIELIDSGVETHSDPNGQFKLGSSDSGSVTLRAVAVGYLATEIPLNAVPGVSDTIEVFLDPAPTGSVEGEVVDENNQPLPGVELQLTLASQLLTEPMIFSALTDPNGNYSFPDLPISDSVWVSYPDLKVTKNFPHPTVHEQNLVVQENSATVVNFQLQPADILLVNDDPADAFQEEFTSALQTANVTPFEWFTSSDGQAIPASAMGELNFPVMVWFTGDASVNVLSQTEQDSLALFLDSGGKLFLTGANIAEDLNNQGSNFLPDYLNVNYDGSAIGAPLIDPVPGNPVFADLSAFTAQQASRDVVSPLTGSNADAAFRYVNNAVAGVTIANGNGSRIVFTGFGWEAISNATIREQLMADVLDWFNVLTGIDEPVATTRPVKFQLFQNYPNPFNPETSIRYQLPPTGQVAASTVLLEIYNLLGQKVRTLVKQQQPPGNYTVRWDGRNDLGQQVSSGVYLYRLTAGNFTRVRKMVLLR